MTTKTYDRILEEATTLASKNVSHWRSRLPMQPPNTVVVRSSSVSRS